MLGAIIGDIVGSRFEFIDDYMRAKDFPLFTPSCCPTAFTTHSGPLKKAETAHAVRDPFGAHGMGRSFSNAVSASRLHADHSAALKL